MPWWLWAMSQGRPVVFSPPYNTEGEALEYGYSRPQLGGDFEVTELRTKDKAEATRAIKRLIFDKGTNLEEALRRAKHETRKEFEND